MVGRSTSVTGPYTDRNGTALTSGGGTQVLAGHGSIHGPGHGGIQRLDPRLERDGEEEVGRGHHLGREAVGLGPDEHGHRPGEIEGLGAPSPMGDGGHQAPPAGP